MAVKKLDSEQFRCNHNQHSEVATGPRK